MKQTTEELLRELEEIKRILEHKSEERKAQELLKDLDAQRRDLERRTALFVPLRQRLERGGKALELGEDYETIKELRVSREKNKIRQASLRDDMMTARTDLHNAEEALTLIEAEYRDKLAEQTKLANLSQKVKTLDEQTAERKEAAINVRSEFEESERELKECSLKVETEQLSLEKIELALREVKKFLQTHAIDEKLSGSIASIRKCFDMYRQAEEKRVALKASLSGAIDRKLQAQSRLNDRSALFSEATHRYDVIEKSYARARAFYESVLKGRTISEWRDVCDKSTKRLEELDELYKKFQEERSLQEKLKNFQEIRLRIQQETRNLNIRDVEQAGKIQELQSEVSRLERRVALLHRIQDLDAVRELLQDGAPCPLCGSITHPYVSGAEIPDPEEMHNQLMLSQKKLDDLRDELTTRQTRTGKLNEEISSIGRDESDLHRQINELNAEISSKVSLLGLKLGSGISPFEELDRERQKTRDKLQLARNAADIAEAAERDMRAAGDELEKIRETREEISRYHQEALFALPNEKTEEERTDSEGKSQEEIVNSLKRELLSQIMPYGYKTLPDKNPEEIVESLTKRMNEWIEYEKRSDELERELTLARTKMANLKKERESLRAKREELASRLKAVEAERDSISQQRIILFASRNPDDEQARMNHDVETLRSQLNQRREDKNDKAMKLDRILTELHTLETDMATGREELQRHEISFSKRLLSLGFKNEDDYAAACLTGDERRDLQNRLRELTQTDLDLKSERENTRARILDLQADGFNVSNDELTERITKLKNAVNELQSHSPDDTDEAAYIEKINGDILPDVKRLILECGLPEIF